MWLERFKQLGPIARDHGVLLVVNGDILTDLAAIVVGSMGLAASANIDPTRTHPSMFEPVHGSAPTIAGKDIANPIGAIASVAMLLRHALGAEPEAEAIEQAIGGTLAAGHRTADLVAAGGAEAIGGSMMARAILARVQVPG